MTPSTVTICHYTGQYLCAYIMRLQKWFNSENLTFTAVTNYWESDTLLSLCHTRY